MTKLTSGQRSALATVSAARASRRTILKSALALGAVGVVGPMLSRNAFSSSGEVNWFTWEDYAPQPLIDKFTAETGIKLNVTTYSSNEDCLNKLKAAGGSRLGSGLAVDRLGLRAYRPTAAWRRSTSRKLPNLEQVNPSFLEQTKQLGATQDGKYYALPYDWGTEALAYNTEKVQLEYGKASFGDLWKPEYKGLMLCRQRSIMLVHRPLDGTDRRSACRAPCARPMTTRPPSIWATARRPSTSSPTRRRSSIGGRARRTRSRASSRMAPSSAIPGTARSSSSRTRAGPITTWRRSKGALSWIDSIALTSGAANLEQAYAFINWSFQPEIGGIVSDATGLQLSGHRASTHLSPIASRRTSPTPIPATPSRSCGCRARSGPGSWRSARRWSTRSPRPKRGAGQSRGRC